MGDLDVEAVDAVVLDLEVADAGALPFACFEVDEEGAAVVVQGAQFIEFGIKAGGDHPAVADQRRRFGGDGAGEEVERGFGRGQCQRQFAEERCRAAGER